MKNPVRWAAAAFAALLVIALAISAAALRRLPPNPGAAPLQGLPWQVEALADGSSRVMGLHLGTDTLAQVRLRTGDGLQVALVARLGEVGVLEALAEPFNAAVIAGRLVLSFEVPAATLARWREGAQGSAPMEDGVRRFTLRPADAAEAERATLSGLSFVPGARLSEDDIRLRFGPPAARRALEGGAVLLRYPQIGVAATVAPGRRGVIQYVAPREAARLGG